MPSRKLVHTDAKPRRPGQQARDRGGSRAGRPGAPPPARWLPRQRPDTPVPCSCVHPPHRHTGTVSRPGGVEGLPVRAPRFPPVACPTRRFTVTHPIQATSPYGQNPWGSLPVAGRLPCRPTTPPEGYRAGLPGGRPALRKRRRARWRSHRTRHWRNAPPALGRASESSAERALAPAAALAIAPPVLGRPRSAANKLRSTGWPWARRSAPRRTS